MDSSGPSTSKSENLPANRKRRFDEEIDQPASKVLIQDHWETPILNLSDEMLLEIIKNLDNYSLLMLGGTCRRLHNIISDRIFWKEIDLRLKGLRLKDLYRVLPYMQDDTWSIHLRGLVGQYPTDDWNSSTISSNLFNKVIEQCPNLTVLEIFEGYINLNKISLSEFPPTLKKLVFNKCIVDFPKQPASHALFTRIEIYLKFLEELVLENCNWFESHDLVMLSKIENLKKLSLKGCVAMRDTVPYASTATRFGFKKLEYLDLRDTQVADSDIQCFNITKNLKTLILECPENLRENAPTKTASIHQIPARIPLGPAPDEYIHVILHYPPTVSFRNRPLVLHNNIEIQQNDERAPQQIVHHAVRHLNRLPATERQFSPPRTILISDRGICGFGLSQVPLQRGIVWIRAENRPSKTTLEKLVVRHYKYVTDTALNHLLESAPNLKYLDVTGTSITAEGIEKFRKLKPNCVIISEDIDE